MKILLDEKSWNPKFFNNEKIKRRIEEIEEKYSFDLEKFREAEVKRNSNRTNLYLICKEGHQKIVNFWDCKKRIFCNNCEGRKKFEYKSTELIKEDLIEKFSLNIVEISDKWNVTFNCKDCGELHTKQYHRDLFTPFCIQCSNQRRIFKNSYKEEDILEWAERNGIKLESRYVNAAVPLKFICPCGSKGSTRYLPDKIPMCRRCYMEKTSGENHWNYKDGAGKDLEEIRFLKKWRRDSLEKYGKKCMITGEKTRLEVHHIKGRTKYPEEKLNLENSFIMTKKLHSEFHSRFDKFKGTCDEIDLEIFVKEKTGKELNQLINENKKY
jgi:5-methylcytosine-specific restriction endonuclease McrA